MENSKIEWTDHTMNPWSGCIKVSPGCTNCYALTLSNRWGKDVWGPGPKRQRTSMAYWQQPHKWNRQAVKEGKRFRVFCASMADVFEDNPQLDDWRSDLWDLIELTPNLDWLLLTKRPENVLRMTRRWSEQYEEGWLDNVWIGTSVENQEYADKRIPELLKIPARIRFLSCEPLLGPLDLEDLAYEAAGPEWAGFNPLVSWVIVGGESGSGARPMKLEWARSLRDQCQRAAIPFFFKQFGEYLPVFNSYTTPDGFDYVKVGKKAAGRLLDGVEWSQFPQVEVANEVL